MPSVCFYTHIHQPQRLKNFSVFDIGQNNTYFDNESNHAYLDRIAHKSYLPTNKILKDLIKRTDGNFKISFSISGSLIEQLESFYPEVLESFKDLANTGNVEFLAETYYHSLAYLYSQSEFENQIEMHKKKIEDTFGQTPKVLRNTELMFNNEIAKIAQDKGYKAILAEGVDHILGWRSPNFVYRAKTADKIKLLLKNYKLSDDVAFRFSERNWKEWPLTAEKFAAWINQVNGNGELVNLFMDYETFGEHQWAETGIFEFLNHFPEKILEHPDNEFLTVSEAADKYQPRDELDIHSVISWADVERDLSAWVGNKMQERALEYLYSFQDEVLASEDKSIIEDWRKLQISDHFYYMCTKWFADGDVHKYFNPYETPYDAFITFMNILNDLKLRLRNRQEVKNKGDLRKITSEV